MKPKAILSSALFSCGVLFGCSTALQHAVTNLDLSAYHIEQVPNPKAASNLSYDWTEWQNMLVFTNVKIRVPLARSAVARFGPSLSENCGFDPQSLKFRWLKEGELLWISWTTFQRGSGGYTYDGNVILHVLRGRSHEIFRDYFLSIAKAGWAAKYYSALNISYDKNKRALTISRKSTNINGDMGVPDLHSTRPFTTTFTNDEGESGYISVVDTIENWNYRFTEQKLRFIDGNKLVVVGDKVQPVEEIVNGFNVTRAELELMNPNRVQRQNVTGTIMIKNQLKPYECGSYDGLHGAK